MRARRESDALIAQLHSAMKQQDWSAIYNGADAAYRSEMSSSDSEQIFIGLDRKLGAPLSTERVNIFAKANPSGVTIQAVYRTKFSKDAEGTEAVLWRKTFSGYELESYRIESKDLMLR